MQELWEHRQAIVNGIRLHYVEAGAGPLVILLHGFPEFWYAWRHQIPALAAAGCHVVAPDMRGYNLSEKPAGVRAYMLASLTADVAALIEHLGAAQATVVGHDWGGGVAWAVPMRYPHLVERLVILNAPHPGAFLRELKTPDQLRKSWYMFFFQLPWLPELAIRSGNSAILRDMLRHEPTRPGAFSEEDIGLYVQALMQPGALTAALNYYRALGRRSPLRAAREIRRIDVPTLLIWGEQDPYLGIRLTMNLERWVSDLRVERIPEASHWVQADAPERVNSLINGFLHAR